MITEGTNLHFKSNKNDVERLIFIRDKYGLVSVSSIIRFSLAFVVNNENEKRKIFELEELLKLEKQKSLTLSRDSDNQ